MMTDLNRVKHLAGLTVEMDSARGLLKEYTVTDEATKGCSDCEYMKDETDGEIDTCDECAAEERAKTNEAGGYYTQPVYDMIEKHGYEKVMHELLTSLDADAIQSFLQRANFED